VTVNNRNNHNVFSTANINANFTVEPVMFVSLLTICEIILMIKIPQHHGETDG